MNLISSSMNDINITENLSAVTPDEILSGKKKKEKSIYDILYEPVPPDYFKDKQSGISFNNNSIEKVIDTYNNMPIKPYIRRTHLGGDGDPADDGAKKSAWEIGLNFSF